MDIDWQNGKLSDCTISSKLGNKCRVRSIGPVLVTDEGKTIETIELEANLAELETKAGRTYRVSPAN